MASNESMAPLWKWLRPGSHAVGLRIEQVHDYGRTFKPAAGDTGARPMQIAVWYPARWRDDAAKMCYEEYVLLEAARSDFRPIDDERRSELLAGYKEYWLGRGADKEKIGSNFDDYLGMAMYAVRDAEPAEGRFPIALYAPGGFSGISCNAVLCEYLASHGYIVAAAPSAGMYSDAMTLDAQGVEAQVRDLEFVLARMKRLTAADPSRVGAVGFSWGGLANVLLAMRNHDIDAAVSLEGGVSYGKYKSLAEDTPFHYSSNLEVPLMLALSGGNEEEDLAFFEERTAAEACLMRVANLGHVGFTSNYILLSHYFEEGPESDKLAPMMMGYGAVCRYTLAFLDAYVRRSEEDRAFLHADPVENGVPPGLLQITWRQERIPPRAKQS